MSVEENKQIVQRFHSEVWAGNLAVIDELLHPEFKGAMGDPEAMKAVVVWSRSVVPDLKFSIEELIAEGDKVVTCWQMSGINTGAEKGPNGLPMPPTGQSFVRTGITINTLLAGKIIADVYENSWVNRLAG